MDFTLHTKIFRFDRKPQLAQLTSCYDVAIFVLCRRLNSNTDVLQQTERQWVGYSRAWRSTLSHVT